jgi:hypothetical protein
MVLYFPVSALVTLFGHILQNPLDPRARSDTKLMNVVVNFLSMLGHEAETGGVHRMLGVCSEFERIAKVVIDKAEKDHASRRKRKNQDQSTSKPTATSNNTTTADQSPSFNPNPVPPTSRPTTASSATPQASGFHTTNNQRHLSPPANDRRSPPNAHNYSPMTGTMSQSPSPGLAPTGWHNDFTPDSSDYNAYAEMAAFGAMEGINAMGMGGPGAAGGIGSPPLAGAAGAAGAIFQQPMLPQDLFSLPMTLDWNWAEMSGGAYPSVENGNFGDLNGGGGGEGMNHQGR